MKLNNLSITPKNSSPDLLSSTTTKRSQSVPKLARQPSIQSSTYKQTSSVSNSRRRTTANKNNDYFARRSTPAFSVPLLVDTMNAFYEAADTMEEEIMLPSRLKDMPVDQLICDNATQPDTWHELYSFIRDIRNQLRCMHPFVDDNDDKNNLKEQQKKENTDDEGIVMPNQDTTVQFSTAFSDASSDEFEQSSTSSSTASYESIKDELKHHYYGLFRSLDQLTSMANRVTDRYREEYLK